MNEISDAPKMLTPNNATALRKNGWKAADLHVHTLFSPDVIPVTSLQPIKLYQIAKQKGMDFVTFTDHDTLAAYSSMRMKMDDLVKGVEIRILDREIVGHTIHINVYELDNWQLAKLEEIAAIGDLHSFLNFLRKENLPHIYNHPLWFEPGEKPNLEAIPDLIKLFPVIEYNMHRVRRKNEIIMRLARKYKKGLIASTDTHSGMVGEAYTISRGQNFKEFYDNICLGRSYIVVRDLTKQYLMQEMNLWLDLLSRQDMMQIGKKITTGIGGIDSLIAILASESLRDYPRIYRAALSAAHKIASSGLPAALYIKKEISGIYEIEQILG